MKYLENGGYSRIGGMRRATLKYQLARPCVRLCQATLQLSIKLSSAILMP